MPRTVAWFARATSLLLLAAAWLLGSAVGAQAHASLLSSSPADGAVLAEAPTEIVLTFDEAVDVRATGVRLVSASGRTLDVGDPAAAGGPDGSGGTAVRVTLPPLADDQYLVRWGTTTSADYHPVAGSFAFAVGVPLQPGFAAATAPAPPWGAAIEALLRLATVLALAGAVGGGLLLWRLRPWIGAVPDDWERLRRWVARSAGLGVAAMLAFAVVMLIRSGALPSGWVALAWVSVLVGLGLVRSRPSRPDGTLPMVAWTGLVAAGWGVSALGHGSGPTAGPLRALLATTHVLATSAWLGGVVVLTGLVLQALRGGRRSWAQEAMRSFGGVAAPAFVVSVVTGLLLAADLVPSTGALTDSTYGRVLVVKGALVVVAGLLGGLTFLVARGRRRRRAEGEDRLTARRLRLESGVLASIALLAAVLATVASPTGPRWAPGDGGPRGTVLSASADDLFVTVTVPPGIPGPNLVRIAVADTRRPSPGPVGSVEVAMDGETGVAATSLGGGDWTIPALSSVDPGEREVVVTIHREGLPEATARIAWQQTPVGAAGSGSGGRGLWGVFVTLALLVALGAAGILGVRMARRPHRGEDRSSELDADQLLTTR